jgi:PAS domain S-box-containing protein
LTKILVVENSKIKGTNITNYLKSLRKNLEIIPTFSAKSALDIISQKKPDIAIINEILPDQPGISLIKRMKDKSKKTHFILITDEDSALEGQLIKDVFKSVDDIVSIPTTKESYKSIGIAIHRFFKEKKLQKTNLDSRQQYLEGLVMLRTFELKKTNERLKKKVNERTWAIEVLRKSLEKYRTLVETSDDMIFTVDLEGNFSFTNKALRKHLGYTEKELEGKNGFELVHPDDLENVLSRFLELPKGKFVSNLEYRYRTKNGSYINILNNAAPIIDSKGKITGAFGIARNITERKKIEEELKQTHDELEIRVQSRTEELEKSNEKLRNEIIERKRIEQALRESKQRYYTIFNKSPDYIYLMDIDGKILDANEVLLDQIGLSLGELKKIDLLDLYAGNNIKDVFQIISQLLAGQEVKGFEVRIQPPHGKPLDLEINAVPFEENGKVTKVLNLARDITKRKHAEEALRESEGKYRDLVENINEIIYSLDRSGVVTYIGPLIKNVLEYEPQEIIGQNFSQFVHQEDRSYSTNRFKENMIKRKDPGVYRVITKSGKIRWLQASSRPIEKAGKIVGLQGILIDITERKEAESALKDSEERFRELSDLLPEGVFEIDLEGNFIFANKKAFEMSGYLQNDIDNGLNAFQIIDSKEHKRMKNNMSRIMKGEDLGAHEYIAKNKDGEKFPVLIHSTAIIQNEKPTGLRGIIIDIKQRKKVEEALRESENRYRGLFEKSSASITLVDTNGIVIDCNESTEKMIGFSKKEIIGKPFQELLTLVPSDLPKLMENFQKLLNGEDIIPYELEIITKDGKRRWIIIRNSLLKKNDNIFGFQIISTDITGRKRAEEALKNKLRESEYLYQLSEEMKYSDTVEDVCKKGLSSVCSGFDFNRGLCFLLNENLEYLNLAYSVGFDQKNKSMKISIWKNESILKQATFENKWFIIQLGKMIFGEGELLVPDSLRKKLGFPTKNDSYIVAPINSKKKVIGVVILDTSNYDLLSQESKEMLDMYLTTIGTAVENVRLYHKLEESLEKLKEIDILRSEFIDVASHELRTPLASIKIYTDLMRDGYIGNFSKNEFSQLEDMNKNIHNLNDLINNMLDFTRTEKDFPKLSFKKVALSNVVKDVVAGFKPIAKARNISLKFSTKGSTVIQSDYEMVKKIFTNLIGNLMVAKSL